MELNQQKKVTSYYVLAALTFLVTAWFSIGFKHGDEHFQIFEFAGYLLGWNKASDMAWEFHTQMRPTLQPILTAGGIRLFDFLGINNPFIQAFIFKICGASLLFLSLVKFLKATQLNNNKQGVLYLLFFGITPYIAARYSSEGIATSMLVFLVATLWNATTTKQFFVAGLFAGLAFAFRFQTAFALVGTVVWYVLNRKFNWKEVVAYIGGFGVLFLLSVGCDRYFYGQWVLAPFNYFFQNIVLNKASNYGTDPWYYYLLHVVEDGFWIPGILVLLFAVVYTFRFPKSILVWMGWLFLVGHMMVAHKETRFLYPILPFLPYVVYTILKEYKNLNVGIWTERILLTANFLLLVPNVFLPASQEISLVKFLEQEYPQQQFTMYFKGQNNPYEDFGLRNNFYGRKRPVFIDQEKLNPDSITKPSVWVSFRCNEEGTQVGKYKLRKIYQTYPLFITTYFNWFNWTSRASVLTIYELEEAK